MPYTENDTDGDGTIWSWHTGKCRFHNILYPPIITGTEKSQRSVQAGLLFGCIKLPDEPVLGLRAWSHFQER